MTTETGVMLKWSQALLAGAVLVAIGAAGTYLVLHREASAPASAPMAGMSTTVSAPAGTAASPSAAVQTDAAVALTADAMQRAGVEVVPVRTSRVSGAGRLRLPGIVQPNGYRTVKVTPLVSGRVTRMLAELGSPVNRDQAIAEIYSPELSEAQTRYLSAKAALDAHERMLQRTEKLAEIGAASRQEVEQAHAEHAALTTSLESARSRLLLLGLSDEQITGLGSSNAGASTVAIRSPIDGVLTERQVNAGMNVETSSPLFTVVDLSTVWVVGNVYERDFAHVRVGTPVTITASALPDLRIDARVSYVDPQVNPDTRTAQIRAEVRNLNHELKLGMYTEMNIGSTETAEALVVPKSAIQTVGNRAVVYLAAPEPGRFVEREVRLGEAVGDDVVVTAGVQAGDRVVSTGSFAIRAERERLGNGR